MKQTLERVSFARLIREFIVFSIKLFIDGLKDVVLFPLAVGVFVVAALVPPLRSRLFFGLMGAGRKFEDRLDLFGPRPGE